MRLDGDGNNTNTKRGFGTGGAGRRWALLEDERGEEAGASPPATALERLLAPSSSLPHSEPAATSSPQCPQAVPAQR